MKLLDGLRQWMKGFPMRDTSAAAFQTVDAEGLRELVLARHQAAGGLTDAELDAERPEGCPTLRPRRCELTRAGVLADTGERRLSPAGRQMIVWGMAA